MLRKALNIIVACVFVFSFTTVTFATDNDRAFVQSISYNMGDVNMDSNINVTMLYWC